MNCLIIDDDELARTIVTQMVNNHEDLQLVEVFSDAIQAIKYLNQHSADLVFLDIHMPNFSGFDFIQTIKNPPKVIFTTADKEFAIDAFEYECIVDYLVKPIPQERFNKAILKANKKEVIALNPKSESQTLGATDNSNELYVNINRRLIKIEFDSITIVKAKGDYIQIKTTEKNYIVHSTFKKIADKLPQSIFLKVHRSFIINVKKIVDIEDNSVLIDNEIIPISRANRSALMKRLNLL